MGVRAIGAFPAGRRDRLINLGTADLADENAVWIGGQDDAHHLVSRREHRLSGVVPESGDDIGVANADVGIDLQGAETEIEQHTVAIFGAQRSIIRTDFRERRAAAHGAGFLPKA